MWEPYNTPTDVKLYLLLYVSEHRHLKALQCKPLITSSVVPDLNSEVRREIIPYSLKFTA